MRFPEVPPGVVARWHRWRERIAHALASGIGLPRRSAPHALAALRRVLGNVKRRWWVVLLVPIATALVVAIRGTGVVEVPWSWPEVGTGPSGGPADAGDQADIQALTRALGDQAPRGPYIVVDQANNRLYLREGDRVLREAVCSAGSGMVLRDSEKGRVWVFDTPRGVFHVQRKARNPVWKKPDWAFIEEGKRPPARASDRLEFGTLGEYALYLGDGYMIHGTLYERLLGRSVTHGCIRLGKEDLRAVHDATEVGTEVYIF